MKFCHRLWNVWYFKFFHFQTKLLDCLHSIFELTVFKTSNNRWLMCISNETYLLSLYWLASWVPRRRLVPQLFFSNRSIMYTISPKSELQIFFFSNPFWYFFTNNIVLASFLAKFYTLQKYKELNSFRNRICTSTIYFLIF